ncbi:MAG: glutamate synthase subunit alpha, partial [Gammaproteobacteria bacterium]
MSTTDAWNEHGLPERQGLYDPRNEHDACGIGFVANIKGRKSHDIVRQGLQVLMNLEHRGAVGADPRAGDGAGILIQIPHEFFLGACSEAEIELPGVGQYGIGMIFLPRNADARDECEKLIEHHIAAEGQTLLGWRDVPVHPEVLSESVALTEPVIRQVFVGRSAGLEDDQAFERKLFVIRKQIANAVRQKGKGYR